MPHRCVECDNPKPHAPHMASEGSLARAARGLGDLPIGSYDHGDDDAAEQRYADLDANPVVRRTNLRAYPGWIVREYGNGIFDAVQDNGVGITIGVNSFSEAVKEVREMTTAFRRETAATQQMVADMERDGLL